MKKTVIHLTTFMALLLMLQPTKEVTFFMYNVALIWPKNYLDLRPGTTSCFFKKVLRFMISSLFGEL